MTLQSCLKIEGVRTHFTTGPRAAGSSVHCRPPRATAPGQTRRATLWPSAGPRASEFFTIPAGASRAVNQVQSPRDHRRGQPRRLLNSEELTRGPRRESVRQCHVAIVTQLNGHFRQPHACESPLCGTARLEGESCPFTGQAGPRDPPATPGLSCPLRGVHEYTAHTKHRGTLLAFNKCQSP